jgi:hypothetical protein
MDIRTDALPYIRPFLKDVSSNRATLEIDDQPVLKDWGNGLAVAYLRDRGNSYQYIKKS